MARSANDFYATPKWVTEALLREVKMADLILEPGAGDGAILALLAGHGYRAVGVEIDHARAIVAQGLTHCRVYKGDFLGPDWSAVDAPVIPVTIVMNPPYSLAADFVRRARQLVIAGGHVHVLLRLGFLGSSRTRLDLLDADSGLSAVRVLSKRPSFTGDGRTDGTEYAWFTWEDGYRGPAIIEVIES
jgi:hypothetical protein